MEFLVILKAVSGVAVIAVLLLGLLWLSKKYAPLLPMAFQPLTSDRIRIVAMKYLDARHRVILLQVDGRESTLLLTPSGALLIPPSAPASSDGGTDES